MFVPRHAAAPSTRSQRRVNSVPTDKAGMASGTTSMLRDFGLTLGRAVVLGGRSHANEVAGDGPT
jgi:hypothetical protein